MDVIIVILNYNDYSTCNKLVENVKNYKIIDKIVLVDNCSTDNSFNKLSEMKDLKVDLIKTKENGGYAYGNNFGIKYAIENYNPKYIIISNPDIEFNEDIIEIMKHNLEKNNDIASINPSIINLDGSRANSGWKLPTFQQDVINMFHIFKWIINKIRKIKNVFIINKNKVNENKINEDEVIYSDVLLGCFFMIKSDIIKKINYFDERTFLYCEERILGKKIKDIGKLQATLTQISCIHAHSTSINKSIPAIEKKYKILFESRKVYYKYYLNFSDIKLLLFSIISHVALLEKKIIDFLSRFLRR